MMRLLKIGLYIIYCVVAIYIAVTITWWNHFFVAGILLPVCSGVVVVLHELSHYICFRLFGFKAKQLRIGLLLFIFEKESPKLTLMDSGMFRGFCTVERPRKNNIRLIFSLAAGGLSGLIISLASLAVLMLDIAPEKWDGLFVSFFCVGLYSFFVTLLSPKSADGKLIKEILNEEIEK